MVKHVCIFEDPDFRKLLPLTSLRPVFDLRCGITTLREKIQRQFPAARVTLRSRDELAGLVRERNPGVSVNEWPEADCLFVNGRLPMDPSVLKSLPPPKSGSLVYLRGPREIAAAYVAKSDVDRLRHKGAGILAPDAFEGLASVGTDVPLIAYPWDLVQCNGEQIMRDAETLRKRKETRRRASFPRGVHVVRPSEVSMGEGVVLKPGTVLDATDGPIVIGPHAVIQPNVVIMGPAAIGSGSLVKPGAHVYDGATIGPVCKIGGEVEASIIQGYSNKQHAGFLGHSFLGSWVNLGAGTTNSDLKNNYGAITVHIDGSDIDTGLRFAGVFMGDHAKSAINTTFNTGTVVGVCSNVFGAGFPPKAIPSFTWADLQAGFSTYSLEKAIAVARTVMGRRKMELSVVEERALRVLFEATAGERDRSGVRGGR